MTIDRDLFMASRAKDVTENEAYIEAVQFIEKEILDQWKKAPARDVEGREKLWLMLHLLNKLQTVLEATMDAGKLAKAELIHKRSLVQRSKDWLTSPESDDA